MVALTLFNWGLMNQDLVQRTQISVVFIVCHALRTILKGHPGPPVLRVQAGNRWITLLPLQLCLFFPFLPGNRPTASAVGSYHILLSSCAFVFGTLTFNPGKSFLEFSAPQFPVCLTKLCLHMFSERERWCHTGFDASFWSHHPILSHHISSPWNELMWPWSSHEIFALRVQGWVMF